MKVMTFNLRCDFPLDFRNRWSARKDIVFDIIDKYDCDIVGVQELTPLMKRDFQSKGKSYNLVGEPRSKKYFVESNDLIVKGECKVVNSKTFWLSKNKEKIGSSIWYSVFPRICTTAVVSLKGGKRVRVYNTHLDFLLPHAREYGFKKLSEYIKEEHEKEKLPTIIMGDFNATPNSKLIKDIKENGVMGKRFVAVQEKNSELYKTSTLGKFKGAEKGVHIDYIFVSEEIEIEEVEIVKYNKMGKYPSDHYPLFAKLKIKE